MYRISERLVLDSLMKSASDYEIRSSRDKCLTPDFSRVFIAVLTVFTFAGISKSTGMDPHDIAATLQILNMVHKKDGK